MEKFGTQLFGGYVVHGALVGQQEGHPAGKKHGGCGCGGIVSLDGVAPTRTAGASASIITSGSTKIQKNDGVQQY